MPSATIVRIGSALSFALIVLTAVVNLWHVAERVPPPPRIPPPVPENVVVRQEQRLAGLRQALEMRGVQGIVGYIADLPESDVMLDPDGVQDLYMSQFALVPCVLDTNVSAHEWAVANLRRTTLADRLPAGFRVVEDFGAGVLLLQRIAP